MIRLTEKQIEAMSLVVRHMTSKEIARELGISHYAIDQRIRSACTRLGSTNRRGAAQAYLEYLEGGSAASSRRVPEDQRQLLADKCSAARATSMVSDVVGSTDEI